MMPHYFGGRLPAVLSAIAMGLLPLGAGTRADGIGESSIPAALILAPSADNPRNSEGDFMQLKDGTLLFIYSHYYAGHGSDHDPAYLAARTSRDGGASWSDDSEKIISNSGKMNVMSVSLLRLTNGEIALFYLLKNGPLDLRPIVRFSTDEARTWSEPNEIVSESDRGYYVVNNDRVVQLASGRLIVPAAFHVDNTPAGFAQYAEAVCFLSDDQGRSWRRGGVARADRAITTGLQEPGVVELSDGRLLMFCRTNAGAQYFAYSSDQGETWTAPQPGTLRSPLSPATIERLPGSTKLLAIWNDNADRGYQRTPLTAAVSSDDGRSWRHAQNIESDPGGYYCYTALEFVDDHAVLAYCAGQRSGAGLATTKIVRLPLAKFTDSATLD